MIQENISWRLVLQCSLVGILVAIFCIVPFFNKAYTVDDPYFLLESQQAVRSPLNPTGTSICWENWGFKRPLRSIGSPAVLMAYVLMPVVLLQGQEWVGHLLILLFLCAGLAATVGMALRCGLDRKQATWAGVFFASTPIILAMGGTVNPDIPVAALAAIGFERLMAWRDEGKLSQALLAGLALGLAPTGRLHALLILPIGALLMLGDRWPNSVHAFKALGSRRWLPIVLGFCVFFAVSWITADRTPAAHAAFVGPNRSQWALYHLNANLPQFGINWLLMTTFAAAWLLLQRSRFLLGALLAVVLAAAGTYVALPDPSPAHALRYGMGVLGGIAIFSVIWWAWKMPQRVWFCLALCLLLPFPIVIYFHLPSKYLPPCIPAAVIILSLRLSELRPHLRTVASAVLVIAGVVMGVLVLQADAEFAGMARDVVRKDVEPLVQPGHHAWYSGQWALTWYGEQAGASCLTTAPPLPQPGDVLVAGDVEGGVKPVLKMDLPRKLVQTISVTKPGGRVMNEAAKAGLFTNTFGTLPWAWSHAPVNTYYVWIIQ